MTTETIEERVQKLENTVQAVQQQLAQQPVAKSVAGAGSLGLTPTTPILTRRFGLGRSGAAPTAPLMRRPRS